MERAAVTTCVVAALRLGRARFRRPLIFSFDVLRISSTITESERARTRDFVAETIDMVSTADRVQSFCSEFGLSVPLLLAPMAGASAPSLSIAVANAGGLGACGALLMSPEEIHHWVKQFRAGSNGAFQLNLWVPDPAPSRDGEHEARVRSFLSKFGPEPAAVDGDGTPPDFEAQCNALVAAHPPIVSSVMGLFGPEFVSVLKLHGIRWFANVSTVTEARAAEAAGADAVVVQGMEAGGHRASFNADRAEEQLVGLFALLPAVVDAVQIPVVATGGIADSRGISAALILGASAAQIGSGFLRCPEAQISPAWAEALGCTLPEGTMLTRAFSGRLGRAIATSYVHASAHRGAPHPAPYPVQRGLTARMRGEAAKVGDIQRMQAWAGQSSALAKAEPAEKLVRDLWREAKEILSLG